MTALYPCPICGQGVRVRTAPSGVVRLVRHVAKANPRSCTGTGWEVADQ